jgi:hypothetical protein
MRRKGRPKKGPLKKDEESYYRKLAKDSAKLAQERLKDKIELRLHDKWNTSIYVSKKDLDKHGKEYFISGEYRNIKNKT